MPRHNNMINHNQRKKEIQKHIKTWLDQPGRKKRRRDNRQKKAAAVYPKPVSGLLRPVVRCPTTRHNTKVKLGRGFTLDELKAAGISAKLAPTVGIAVDYRRKNGSTETFNGNVQRLKLYQSKLVVFPRRADRIKAGDAQPAETENVVQQTTALAFTQPKPKNRGRVITEEEKQTSAYLTLRKVRKEHRRVGKPQRDHFKEFGRT
eukprot:TRINITY_DN1_c0_g2_i1.p1 TRINITY_DN1_c0_g2~~TRINITY_DN1_c0_g2_i1.p1  ORF type:complete len:205 (+),score=60.81 TRINITY_DN1_c0_g2_i1:96-710(+)